MKCFYHSQIDAVAICKNCSKGLCMECVADVGNGVACKGKCEAHVIAVNELIGRNHKSHERAASLYSKMAIWVALLGLSFTIAGFISWQKGGSASPIVFGLIFLAGSILYYTSARKYRSRD
jgi:hypothetical protein